MRCHPRSASWGWNQSAVETTPPPITQHHAVGRLGSGTGVGSVAGFWLDSAGFGGLILAALYLIAPALGSRIPLALAHEQKMPGHQLSSWWNSWVMFGGAAITTLMQELALAQFAVTFNPTEALTCGFALPTPGLWRISQALPFYGLPLLQSQGPGARHQQWPQHVSVNCNSG